MKKIPSRRLFLRKYAMAKNRITLFPSISTLIALSKEESSFNRFISYFEETADLRTSSLFVNF